MFKKIAVFLITVYQYTFSLDHGPLRVFFPMGFCRFHPSCSEYGKQAIDKYGVFKGSWLAVWRIMRCNPWNRGGDDQVPPKFIKLKVRKVHKVQKGL